MKLYTIFDSVADEYGPLFEAKNDDVAIRNFKTILDANKISPKEFDLWQSGSFDHDSGVVSDDQNFVCNGADLFVLPELDFEGDVK